MLKFNVKNVLIMSLVFFILLYLRRGEQLLSPEIWNEDGTQNFISFLNHGWMNLLEPVSGYLITVPKLITNISLSISALYYPEISTYLAWIFTIFVALAVAYAPTHIKYPSLAAIMIFLIPTNAEVFGLPLYTFWFSSILLFVVALWKQQEKQFLKYVFLVLGGLSSAVIVLIIPIQIFRILFLKFKKEEVITLVVAGILATVQLSFIVNTNAKSHMPYIDLEFIQLILIKFFAFYAARDFISNDVILVILGASIVTTIFMYLYQNRKDSYLYILLFLLFSSIALSVVRLDLTIISPVHGGPRYFFFPYILLSWVLLYIIAQNKKYALFFVPIMFFSVVLSTKDFSRVHDGLDWKSHLYTCSQSKGTYALPIQYDGNINSAWKMNLKSDQCKELLENDTFGLPASVNYISHDLFHLKKLHESNIFDLNINNQRYVSDVNKVLTNNVIEVSPSTVNIKIEGWVSDISGKNKPKAVIASVGTNKKLFYLGNHSYVKKNSYEGSYVVGYVDGMLDIFELKSGDHVLEIHTVNSSYTGYYDTVRVKIHKSDMGNLLRLPIMKNELKGWIDKFQVAQDKIYISGWYSNINSPVSSNTLMLDIDGTKYITRYGYSRKDVALALKNENYAHSGFKLVLDKDKVDKGKHVVKVFILSDDLSILYEDTNTFEFEVK